MPLDRKVGGGTRWTVMPVASSSWLRLAWWGCLLGILLKSTPEALACTGRTVLNATSGTVTDGPNKYPASAHCEWLIDAGGPGRFIQLVFESMRTECSYDYLFVYDGKSFTSELLGSFSGSTRPDPILAVSGYMLIYFYSDRNYVLEGFKANYTITDCPFNCSGNGACDVDKRECLCTSGFTGAYCDVELCPGGCGGHGTCDGSRCVCAPGYAGMDCRLATNSSGGQSTWYQLSPGGQGFTARTGHVGAFLIRSDSLYVFGGTTLNLLLDDLARFDMATSTWSTVNRTQPWPSARHNHAVVSVGDAQFYMYGGLLSDGSMSDELWRFDASTERWELLASASVVRPPQVSSHTLTLVELAADGSDTWLYLFGGRTADGRFLSDIHRIRLPSAAQWKRVETRGGKEASRRLVGHSTVFHRPSMSLLVFGGFSPDYARFPKRTHHMHAFHVLENHWSQIFYAVVGEQSEPPKDRAFHTATIMDNYMVVYGGNCHIHHHEEVCYDNQIHFYHLGCHRWVSPAKMEEAFPGKSESVTHRGRFLHVAVPAYGNTLLISGGYSGSVLSDLIAYTVPVSIAKNWDDTYFGTDANHCGNYTVHEFCVEDPECVWCLQLPDPGPDGPQPGCLHRRQSQVCMKDVRKSSCVGLCEGLQDCASCTVQGQGATQPSGPLATLWHNERCAWCTKGATCQKLDAPSGACSATYASELIVDPWWGRNSTRPQTLQQCRLEDYPAGLHWVRYRHPMDEKHPDSVEITRHTGLTFLFEPVFDSENLAGTLYTSMFRGFVHPMGAESSNGPPLQVFLVSVSAIAKLYMSTDDSVEKKELIAELTNAHYVTKEARRGSTNDPVFPDESPAAKYYLEQVAQQDVAGPKVTQVASNMQLEWTGGLRDISRVRQEFTAQYLEPYNDAALCAEYTSCLGCMTNTACGWCQTARTCVLKADVTGGQAICAPVDGAQLLVTYPPDCPICADHISCDACAQDPLCEWLSHEARCLRRFRFDDAVRNVTECPANCRSRHNCTSCLSERNECAWCEQTRECFPFVEYTMAYAYGGCTQWVDSMSEQQCHDCSRHSTCADCLTDFQCGWCGNEDNPTLGRCLHGDFTGPELGTAACPALIAEVANVSAVEPAAWSYGICPDVEECRLGLHDCHEHASCINTFESFVCMCNRGYTGNGKDVCNRTCYYDCVHGSCSGAPDYVCLCDIGWTGSECNINCGCNNHSTCLTAVGVCDECQHWTTGEHCEQCQPGAFGDGTTTGCEPCDCNDHGDQASGVCNSTTGRCYCRDNTEGDHCERCRVGYYGDPRGGNRCYLRCEGRSILGNITTGALGSHAGRGVQNSAHAYCLWILTLHPDLTNLRLLDPVPTITFSMETDIKTLCSRDYVYVYDGIPSFMTSSSSSSATLLAAFCGYNYNKPLRVEASSGYLTVYFEGNIEPSSSSTRGFNATYRVNSCSEGCHGNRVCSQGRCVCAQGYGGIDCSVNLCPGNCSASLSQGTCDMTLGQCICEVGFGGPSCDLVLTDRIGVYSTVYDPWRVHGQEAFNSKLSRMGHTLVSCGDRELYVFGGYSLSHGMLSDVWSFNLDTGRWTQLTPATDEQPSSRYFHAAVCVPTTRAMYVFGGITEEVGAVREMWKFTLDSKRWRRLSVLDQKGEAAVPAMAGHSMTLVNQTKIIVIGGFSSTNFYSESVYEYDAKNNHWQKMELDGSQATGLYGHTAVYHTESNAIYVFGGYEYQTDKTAISSSLYTVDLVTKTWSLLPSETGNAPTARAFHAAVTTSKYMVVLGGRTPQDDFDGTAYAYRYSCNHWTDLTAPDSRGSASQDNDDEEDLEGSGSAGGVAGSILGDGPPRVIGPAALAGARAGGLDEVYVMGGFSAVTHGSLVRLTLPSDLCALRQNERDCLATLGCAACIDEDTNITYCYTNEDPTRFDCAHGTAWRFVGGETCDLLRLEQRDCNQHKTCTECLAMWPSHRYHERVCQWCSNCPTGKCIPKDKNCQRANACERQQRDIRSPGDCVERLCQASDCDKCADLGNCIWTRQFKRSSEVGRTLSLIPIYDWNCVVKSLLDATPYEVQSSPPNACPQRCYQFTSCSSCISTVGGEGGSQECAWSIQMQECMPPAYLPLRCSNGECGLILMSQASQCPQPCSIHHQCSSCLAAPGCGWCALGGLNGLGICMEGGLTRPRYGACNANNISLGTDPLPEPVANWTQQAKGPPIWSFGQCLPENECLNGHHNCDQNENCTDLPEGFRCNCKLGYARDSSRRCRPHCKQTCEPHGDCVAPNICKCHFGYVGHNCSTECQCNKHSDCKSVTERHYCLACQNNTKGNQCQECKPLFVGNPVNGGNCKSCSEFCNFHSDVCLPHDYYHLIISVGTGPQLKNLSMIDHGPKSEDTAICIDCRENTQGDRCEKCKSGYFRISADNPSGKCEKCKCNGHSFICDEKAGTNCDCKNNTKSPRCEGNSSNGKQCYELQCSECIDSFLGKPTDDHQCYRQMTVDRDYCLDPTTQMNCNLEPDPLHPGRTVFFAVQPKYLNVDIRITLDVTRGEVDLFFSPFAETYTVQVDQKTGIHHVNIDPKFSYALGDRRHVRVTRQAPVSTFTSIPADDSQESSPSATGSTIAPSAGGPVDSTVSPGTGAAPNGSDPRGERSAEAANETYTYEELAAHDFNTFVKLTHKDVFLRVRGVRHRLVITLPQGVHELKVSRFYLVLLATAGPGGGGANETYGNLFFRQDQPHIDLFVFFSVFFSCFFIFLAKCVFLWKIKQAMDARRSRHRHRLEMQHLASRPFARARVVIVDSEPPEMVPLMLPGGQPTMTAPQLATSTPLPRKTTLPKLYSKYSITSDSFESATAGGGGGGEKFTLRPLALEPTDDGVAAVATFFFQLPGGKSSPVRACLGSCLVQSSRVLFPSAHQPKGVYIRRQPSSSA